GYVNAIRVSIQPATLHKIAMCFPELNTGWLMVGEGEMLKPTPNTYKNIAFGNKGDNNNIVQGDAIVYGADNETQQLKRKLTELEDRYNALIVSKDDLLKEKDERIKELNNMIRILSQNK
ncbi:MAG: hypothetical protein RR341_08355, partial [Bacteroidales bacterium]